MEEGRHTPPAPTTEDPARLRAEIEELQEEVLRLQHKLGELHDGDYNALRRAYTSLCQHVAALEEEARGMVAQLGDFETVMVPPELVAKELGVAAAITFGVGLLHTTVRSLPMQIRGLGKGLWLLGGAYVLARLTGGALAHMAGMFSRNASRKRRLMRKLQAVEERITIMSALQQWAEKQAALAGGEEGAEAGAAAPPGGGGGGWGGEEQAQAFEVPPPRRVSPAASSGSSAELVEMPRVEELEAAEAGEAGGHQEAAQEGAATGAAAGDVAGPSGSAGGQERASSAGAQRPARAAGGRSGSGGEDPGLLGLMAYVALGQNK